MDEILIKSKSGPMAIPGFVIMALFCVLYVYLIAKMPFNLILLLAGVFCFGLALVMGLSLAYIDIPALKIAPDKIMYRKAYSKEYKQLMLSDISNFEYKIDNVRSFGIVTQRTFTIKAKLKAGGSKKITVSNPEDAESVARTLNYYLVRANCLSAAQGK